MPHVTADAARSILLVVDIQPSFMQGIHESERVLIRSEFLVKVARKLEIPVIATEQYAERMGHSDSRILSALENGPPAIDKMSFSCCGNPTFIESLRSYDRMQAVLVGIETHICISQTAHDLLGFGYEVFVCPDAVSARTLDRHKIGMERVRDAGAVPAHTESVAYEWVGSATNSAFKDVLKFVKEAQAF